MSRQEIIDFCDLFDACDDGREWALEYCDSLADAWAKAPHDYLIWIATRPGVLTDRELRLFACWCVRQVWCLLTDERSRTAVEVAERHAIGEATDEELSAAMSDAMSAAWSAAISAARSAAWSDAWSDARAVAYAASRDVAWSAAISAAMSAAMSAAWSDAMSAAWSAAISAARSAAWSDAWSSARSAAWSDARAAQDAYLREHCQPDFAHAMTTAKEVAS